VSGGPHPSKKGRTWKDQTCTIGITTRCRSVVFVGFQNPPIITYLFKQIHYNRSVINPTVRLVTGPGAGGEFTQDPQVRRVATRGVSSPSTAIGVDGARSVGCVETAQSKLGDRKKTWIAWRFRCDGDVGYHVIYLDLSWFI
jgi:hypothetical protein